MATGILIILIVATAPYFYKIHKRLQKLEQEVQVMKNRNQ